MAEVDTLPYDRGLPSESTIMHTRLGLSACAWSGARVEMETKIRSFATTMIENGPCLLVFFTNPIGAKATGIGPGAIPGTNPSTTPFSERGLHLDFSRWFCRTRPTLI